MKGLKLTFWTIVLLILLSMAWQNIPPLLDTDITLGYEIWRLGAWQSAPIPLYAVIIICFLAGLFLMWVLDLSTRLRLRRQVRALEKELAGLRAQTGYDEAASLDSYADETFDDGSESSESDETSPK
jgi:uncharacterized integral membrane protein